MKSAHIGHFSAYRNDQSWINDFNATFFYLDDPPYSLEAATGGTSFAAPVVTGVVARLVQQFPTMTVDQVWNLLSSTATVLGDTNGDGISDLDFDGDGIWSNNKLVYISPLY